MFTSIELRNWHTLGNYFWSTVWWIFFFHPLFLKLSCLVNCPTSSFKGLEGDRGEIGSLALDHKTAATDQCDHEMMGKRMKLDTCHSFFVAYLGLALDYSKKMKNKMKPTNPNADTYVDKQRQYLFVAFPANSLVRQPEFTHWGDTLVRHSHLGDTLVRHSHLTFL